LGEPNSYFIYIWRILMNTTLRDLITNRTYIDSDDTDLRESMKSSGWLESFPAIVDENGLVLVGHRRLKVAKELGIIPIRQVITFGNGDKADIERLKLVFSDNGFKAKKPEYRQRIAKYLYEKGWVMEKIAEALGIGVTTVHRDLDGFSAVEKPAPIRPQGGRPKGGGGTSRPNAKHEKAADLASRGASTKDIAGEVGLSVRRVQEILKDRKETTKPTSPRQETTPDSKQKHVPDDAEFERRVEKEVERRAKKLETEFERRVEKIKKETRREVEAELVQERRQIELDRANISDLVRQRCQEALNSVSLPSYVKEWHNMTFILKHRKGAMSLELWKLIDRCIHPDNSASPETRHKAFVAWREIPQEKLVDNKELPRSPAGFPNGVPSTYEELMKVKEAAAAQRSARARQQAAARANKANGTSH
jgi:predicted transcriptional regulator